MKIKNANIWTKEHGFVSGGISFTDTIEQVGVVSGADAIDAEGMYLIPGFVDIHVHGALGHDFSDASAEGNEIIARRLVQHGVTSYLHTTMTVSEEQMVEIAKTVDCDNRDPNRSGCVGIHLEGPFLSYRKRGAQHPDHLRAADYLLFRRVNEISGGNVRLVAVAPEIEGGMEFIRMAHEETTVSLAHTCAEYDLAMEAFRAGADHVTHLFNGMDSFLHRAPGVVGAAMDSGAYAELICDGLHVHPSVVRAAFKMFPGRIVLISDAVQSAGMADGNYLLGGLAITMKDGRTTLADGTLAGSNITLLDALRNAVSFGISLEEAIEAATLRPAVSVRVDHLVGSLKPGKRADFLLLDKELNLHSVYHFGQAVTLSK